MRVSKTISKLGHHEMGTPNLGTFWVVEFVVVTLEAFSVTGDIVGKKELKGRLVLALTENDSISLATSPGAEVNSGTEGEAKEFEGETFNFNLPQPFHIPGGQSVGIEIKNVILSNSPSTKFGVSKLVAQATLGYDLYKG